MGEEINSNRTPLREFLLLSVTTLAFWKISTSLVKLSVHPPQSTLGRSWLVLNLVEVSLSFFKLSLHLFEGSFSLLSCLLGCCTTKIDV